MTSEPTLHPDTVRAFVIAGHGDMTSVREMLAVEPALLNMAHEWGPGDTETALQAAAHVGDRAIAEYLLAQGAPNDITTAAMLGDRSTVEAMLADDPDLIAAVGAHSISLLAHAAWSGDVGLVAMLTARGATRDDSMALSHAVTRRSLPLVRWLLEEADPDLAWENFQGQTVLDTALALDAQEVADLLRAYGAETSAGPD